MRAVDSVRTVLWPLIFSLSLSYVVWSFPAYILRFGPPNDALALRAAPAVALDLAMLMVTAAALVIGVIRLRPGVGEGELKNVFDRISLFLSCVTMLLVVALVLVMLYEVVLRYVFERPTLWANELSLWMAGFIFLLSGLYAMQQRTHIRIYLLYDLLPRSAQRLCDTVSALLIAVFAAALVWGSYNEAYAKLMRWETFGTAFDPPIPATMKPMILVVIVLVAIQAIVNLIADWNAKAEIHTVVDTDEIETVINTVGQQHIEREDTRHV